MLLLFLLPLLHASMLQKMLRPGAKEMYYCILGDKDVEATIQLNNYSEEEVYYRITREGKRSPNDDFVPLAGNFSEKYTSPGTYKIELFNEGEEAASVGIYTNVIKADRINNDNLAIKNLFLDIEKKLQAMFDFNMRLKTVQEKNITEARKIRLGFYVMFGIPIIYVIIGFAKYKATQRMFNPKKGQTI
jgi:hypothetical protein